MRTSRISSILYSFTEDHEEAGEQTILREREIQVVKVLNIYHIINSVETARPVYKKEETGFRSLVGSFSPPTKYVTFTTQIRKIFVCN